VKPGEGIAVEFPSGLAAKALQVVKLDRRPSAEEARNAGATLAIFKGRDRLTLCAGAASRIGDLALGLVLRAYDFDAHKTGEKTARDGATVFCAKPDEARAEAEAAMAVAEGVVFTRDLVNEPSNVLTTEEFAARLLAMKKLGLKIEVLEEKDLEKLGMRALLGVGQGSESPSKVVVMEWAGGGEEKPLALIGKGVVFDTGGISIKPAAGMEDMTMDMGGAGVVAGVMRALALRKAKANVVGLVGLVENMPDGRAQRPGDVVRSMKGDTIEVINTDAEGRLVLCDVMWYAQDRFEPTAMIDLATLTGAIIIGLGHENAGVFSNNDALANAFLKAAKAEGEGAWRMPLGKAYDDMLKSNIADMKNVGGRAAGSITAAQFLQRFVKDETPWIHLDIAGVASVKSDTALAPKGATGWGVMALDRLVRDAYEAG
jgi:leucyl aminopeptidase